jgi:hypothetical protein
MAVAASAQAGRCGPGPPGFGPGGSARRRADHGAAAAAEGAAASVPAWVGPVQPAGEDSDPEPAWPLACQVRQRPLLPSSTAACSARRTEGRAPPRRPAAALKPPGPRLAAAPGLPVPVTVGVFGSRPAPQRPVQP